VHLVGFYYKNDTLILAWHETADIWTIWQQITGTVRL